MKVYNIQRLNVTPLIYSVILNREMPVGSQIVGKLEIQDNEIVLRYMSLRCNAHKIQMCSFIFLADFEDLILEDSQTYKFIGSVYVTEHMGILERTTAKHLFQIITEGGL